MKVEALRDGDAPLVENIKKGQRYRVYAETPHSYVIAFSTYTVTYPKGWFKVVEE